MRTCSERLRCGGRADELKALLLSLSLSSSDGGGNADTQREYWMREFDSIQHDGRIAFDEFQLHLARCVPAARVKYCNLAARGLLRFLFWECTHAVCFSRHRAPLQCCS